MYIVHRYTCTIYNVHCQLDTWFSAHRCTLYIGRLFDTHYSLYSVRRTLYVAGRILHDYICRMHGERCTLYIVHRMYIHIPYTLCIPYITIVNGYTLNPDTYQVDNPTCIIFNNHIRVQCTMYNIQYTCVHIHCTYRIHCYNIQLEWINN